MQSKQKFIIAGTKKKHAQTHITRAQGTPGQYTGYGIVIRANTVQGDTVPKTLHLNTLNTLTGMYLLALRNVYLNYDCLEGSSGITGT